MYIFSMLLSQFTPPSPYLPVFTSSFSCVSIQLSSVIQSCPTLCNPMNRSTPGLPVHHQLPEFTQAHVHRVDDVIQPSSSVVPFYPALNLFQHQGLFK